MTKTETKHVHRFSIDTYCECGAVLSEFVRKQQEVIRAAKAYLDVIHGDDSLEAIALREAISKAEGKE